MKGKLIKTTTSWGVWCQPYLPEDTKFTMLSLHPDDIKTINQYGDYSVDWDGKEVDFNIVDEFTHPELYKFNAWGEGNIYAKLI
jgi:hypothetical protein